MRVLLVIALLCRTAHADGRGGYIAELIDALRTTDRAQLDTTRKYIQMIERNKCQAPEMSLRVGCLLEAAAQNCKPLAADARQRCLRASDVIATNLLAERVFVPDDVRFEIAGKERDARAAIARELHRRYASLVTELAMSRFFPGPRAAPPALATAIDGFCTEVAGTRDLSWQYCVSAIVWFVARDGDTR